MPFSWYLRPMVSQYITKWWIIGCPLGGGASINVLLVNNTIMLMFRRINRKEYMSLFTMRFNGKHEFDDDNISMDNMIMNATGLLENLKSMQKLGVVAEDNQGGIIGMSCETTDPTAIVELKKLGFEEEK